MVSLSRHALQTYSRFKRVSSIKQAENYNITTDYESLSFPKPEELICMDRKKGGKKYTDYL